MTIHHWRAGASDGGSYSFGPYGVGDTGIAELGPASPGAYSILESNFFPTTLSPWISLSIDVSGTGTLRFGVLLWSPDYTDKRYDFTEIDLNTGDGYQRVKYQVALPSDFVTAEAQMRVEWEGASIGEGSYSSLYLKEPLADYRESQFEYFDGYSTHGLNTAHEPETVNRSSDFKWHGHGNTYITADGTEFNGINQHFSLWYNNFANTQERLFGSVDEDNEYTPGLVESWIPTGSSVAFHWEQVAADYPSNWQGDYFWPLQDVSLGGAAAIPCVEIGPFQDQFLGEGPLGSPWITAGQLSGLYGDPVQESGTLTFHGPLALAGAGVPIDTIRCCGTNTGWQMDFTFQAGPGFFAGVSGFDSIDEDGNPVNARGLGVAYIFGMVVPGESPAPGPVDWTDGSTTAPDEGDQISLAYVNGTLYYAVNTVLQATYNVQDYDKGWQYFVFVFGQETVIDDFSISCVTVAPEYGALLKEDGGAILTESGNILSLE